LFCELSFDKSDEQVSLGCSVCKSGVKTGLHFHLC
jgi:hypothetical protein